MNAKLLKRSGVFPAMHIYKKFVENRTLLVDKVVWFFHLTITQNTSNNKIDQKFPLKNKTKFEVSSKNVSLGGPMNTHIK